MTAGHFRSTRLKSFHVSSAGSSADFRRELGGQSVPCNGTPARLTFIEVEIGPAAIAARLNELIIGSVQIRFWSSACVPPSRSKAEDNAGYWRLHLRVEEPKDSRRADAGRHGIRRREAGRVGSRCDATESRGGTRSAHCLRDWQTSGELDISRR